MHITDVRIKLSENSTDRLKAYCSITIDNEFVIRDLKIIAGTSGPFVAMPSRKLSAPCPQCRYKNHLKAAYCNQCGVRLKENVIAGENGRFQLHADIAHPINAACREMIQLRVLAEFQAELNLASQPGYRSTYDDLCDEVLEQGPLVVPPQAAQHATITAGHPHPRGPHTPPATTRAERDDDFGAGIF